MLTAEDLRAIAGRIATEQGDGCLAQCHDSATQAYADRAALFAYVEIVAKLRTRYSHGDGECCPLDGYPIGHPGHKHCPWLAAQGAIFSPAIIGYMPSERSMVVDARSLVTEIDPVSDDERAAQGVKP